ncbi:hypothetical protein PGB90_002780 [Kerria lacca]
MRNFRRFIFQQDGGKPHMADETLLFLRQHFKARVISNRFPTVFNSDWSWPLYSPDLSPLDYFFWGYVKDLCYANRSSTIEKLKNEIMRIFNTLETRILELVIRNFLTRLHHAIENSGRHIENVIY